MRIKIGRVNVVVDQVHLRKFDLTNPMEIELGCGKLFCQLFKNGIDRKAKVSKYELNLGTLMSNKSRS
jgi:hypothetical protein